MSTLFDPYLVIALWFVTTLEVVGVIQSLFCVIMICDLSLLEIWFGDGWFFLTFCLSVCLVKSLRKYFRYAFMFYCFWGNFSVSLLCYFACWAVSLARIVIGFFVGLGLLARVREDNFKFQIIFRLLKCNHHQVACEKCKEDYLPMFTCNCLHIASGRDLRYTIFLTYLRIYVRLLLVEKPLTILQWLSMKLELLDHRMYKYKEPKIFKEFNVWFGNIGPFVRWLLAISLLISSKRFIFLIFLIWTISIFRIHAIYFYICKDFSTTNKTCTTVLRPRLTSLNLLINTCNLYKKFPLYPCYTKINDG